MGSRNLNNRATHFYMYAGNGMKLIVEHGGILIGVCDASGTEYCYGDRIEVTPDNTGSDIKTAGSGIILRVWNTDDCFFEVLMDNGERGFIQPKFVKKKVA